jgi:hypothetical protein
MKQKNNILTDGVLLGFVRKTRMPSGCPTTNQWKALVLDETDKIFKEVFCTQIIPNAKVDVLQVAEIHERTMMQYHMHIEALYANMVVSPTKNGTPVRTSRNLRDRNKLTSPKVYSPVRKTKTASKHVRSSRKGSNGKSSKKGKIPRQKKQENKIEKKKEKKTTTKKSKETKRKKKPKKKKKTVEKVEEKEEEETDETEETESEDEEEESEGEEENIEQSEESECEESEETEDNERSSESEDDEEDEAEEYEDIEFTDGDNDNQDD